MLLQIKSILRKHWLVLLLAMIVGAISVAPQIYLLKDQSYKGIQMFGTDAEYDYVAKINKAQYDDYSKGPFPPDPGKNFYLAPELGERSMGLLAKLFHISAVNINIIFKFVCPALLFLIMYGWLLEMFSMQSVAIVAPLFVILGINLLDPTGLIKLASLRASLDSFLPYTRPISPEISSLFLFLGLWGIYCLVNEKLNFRNTIILGLLSGLSLYSYIYSWSFITVLSGLYFLFFLIKKEKERMKHFFLMLAVNLIVALPFFLNLLKAKQDIDYIDTSARIGTVPTHTPILGGWIVLGYLALMFLWPKAYKNTKYFFLFVFTTLVVVLNQQLITGFKLQPDHYHWYTTKPIVAIILTFLILYWVEKISARLSWKKAVPLVLSAVFFLNSIVVQACSYRANYQTYQNNQRYVPLLSYLSQDFLSGKNIWASPDLSTLILAYTKHNAPDSTYAPYYLNSREHLRGMLFLEYRLRGVAVKNIASVINQESEYIMSKVFGIYYHELPGNHQLPDVKFLELISAYGDFYKVSLEQNFKDLKIGLIVEDKKDFDLHLEKFPFLSQVSIGGGVFVYQFKNK